METESTY